MAKTDAKPNYPSKLCPKCGKYIHLRSKSHEECGWKDTSTSAPAKAAKPANGKPMSKMEGVRQALGKLGNDAKPLEIKDYLKKQFKISMEPTVISSYKTSIFAKQRTGRKSPGRPAGRPSASAKAAGQHISIEDIRAVKDLAERIGVERLRQLADVLAH